LAPSITGIDWVSACVFHRHLPSREGIY